MEQLNDIIFYHLEKAIKSYRQYAQKQIDNAGIDITIDQWLILKSIEADPTLPQQQIAAKAFKDVASITRIIELLVKKEYLMRDFHESDRRRFRLTLTDTGKQVLKTLQPIIINNRNTALNGITQKDAEKLSALLQKIAANVSM